MRRTILVLLLAVLLLPPLSHSGEAPALSLSLMADRVRVSQGEDLNLRVRLRNLSTIPVVLPRPADGSDHGIRFPHALFEVRDARGRLVGGRGPDCKVCTPLSASAFIRVPPGATVDLYPKGYSLHLGGRAESLASGTYFVTCRFSTMAAGEWQWHGPYTEEFWRDRASNSFWREREPELAQVRRLLAQVPRVDLQSAALGFQVVEAEGTTREEALRRAEEICGAHGWPWERPHVAEDQGGWVVTTKWGSLGGNAYIRFDKQTGRVTDQHLCGP